MSRFRLAHALKWGEHCTRLCARCGQPNPNGRSWCNPCTAAYQSERRKTMPQPVPKQIRVREYAAWGAMIQRCTNPRHPRWKYYGARGITVCARWRQSFDAFLADMGRKPHPSLTLDRRNNDGHYEPGNCRWATWTEQRANRRKAA